MSDEITNDKAFKLFCEQCNIWIQRYGLFDWRIDYSNDFDDEGSLASCSYNYASHAVLFNMLPLDRWPEEMKNEKDLRYVAFHEVTELLISDLRELTKSRNITEEQVEVASHAIIHRLENAFYVDADFQAE